MMKTLGYAVAIVALVLGVSLLAGSLVRLLVSFWPRTNRKRRGN